MTVFIILYGSYITFFPLLLGGRFGAGPAVIGLLMSTLSISTGITSTRTGSLTARFPKRNLLLAGFSLYALAMALVPLIGSLPFFICATVLFGMGQGINLPVIQTMLNDLAPDRYRAAYMSTNGLVIRIGQTIGPLLMIRVEQWWGIETVFYAGAALAMAGVLVLLLTVNRT
jgi:MFS family permease